MSKVLFNGWDEIVKARGWLRGHRETMFEIDEWRPPYLVWVLANYQDRFSSALSNAVLDWIKEQCQDRRWRHVYAGVYEFDNEDDAKAFAEKWANHDGDTDPFDDMFMC